MTVEKLLSFYKEEKVGLLKRYGTKLGAGGSGEVGQFCLKGGDFLLL
jgi:hypothetical protein